MSFEARYRGHCALCDEPIHIGDLATYALDDVLTHVDCDGSSQPERKAEICTSCWLAMPCGCGGAA